MKKKIRILVTGSNGQLGKSFQSLKNFPEYFDIKYTNRDDLDITNMHSLQGFFSDVSYDFILNFAAFTDVEKAESEYDQANRVNSSGLENLAKIGNLFNIFIIHISTDYVFDGYIDRLYTEKDIENPLNRYGKSKLDGEKKLKLLSSRFIIIRVSWLYSEFNKNFFNTMIHLAKTKKSLSVVSDQISSPTYAVDFSRNLIEIIKKIYLEHKEKPFQEIFHYSNTGTTSWHNFAKEIFNLMNFSIDIKKIDTKNLELNANRPCNSSLNSKKITDFFDIKIETWKDSLLNCVNNYQKANL